MFRIKRWLVATLDTVDAWLDAIPSLERPDDNAPRRWYRRGLWGCRLGLAHLSGVFDDRWKTGVWGPYVPGVDDIDV